MQDGDYDNLSVFTPKAEDIVMFAPGHTQGSMNVA
jgi:hypothetical protein